LPSPASIQGQWWENLFYWTLVATVPIFVITHVLLFGFAFKYRGRKGNKSFYYPHNNKLELIWTAIPSAVLVLLVYQGIQEWLKITGWAPTKDEAVVVEATGKQFMWDLRYAGTDNVLGKKAVKLISGDNSFGMDWKDPTSHDDFSATELHLPVDKQVLVKVNALDVLHCFALPHFVVKIDAVPGIPTEVWFTPIKTTAQMRAETGNPDFNYELACMELCGAGHYNMRRVVVVETQDEFNKWFKDQKSIYAGAKTSEAKTTAENNIIPPDTKPASSTTAEPAKVASGH
jgi:cytochrome c oxidase subunit 2